MQNMHHSFIRSHKRIQLHDSLKKKKKYLQHILMMVNYFKHDEIYAYEVNWKMLTVKYDMHKSCSFIGTARYFNYTTVREQ